jgi:hypothetical protein
MKAIFNEIALLIKINTDIILSCIFRFNYVLYTLIMLKKIFSKHSFKLFSFFLFIERSKLEKVLLAFFTSEYISLIIFYPQYAQCLSIPFCWSVNRWMISYCEPFTTICASSSPTHLEHRVLPTWSVCAIAVPTLF